MARAAPEPAGRSVDAVDANAGDPPHGGGSRPAGAMELLHGLRRRRLAWVSGWTWPRHIPSPVARVVPPRWTRGAHGRSKARAARRDRHRYQPRTALVPAAGVRVVRSEPHHL